VAAIHPVLWIVGLVLLIGLAIVAPNPILILILIIGGLEAWRRWKTRKQGLEGNEAYYRVKPAHRLLVGVVYVALIAVCAVGMDLTFVDRSSAI